MKLTIAPLLVHLLFVTCKKSNNKIIGLLQSENKDANIEGAFLAGESGNKEFIPYLLKNSYDYSMGANI
jgi:hypothetical protein